MEVGNRISSLVSLRLECTRKADLSAVRFVLSDKYTSMNREERQRLLHDGTSTTTTMSAYVEIVFDSELLVTLLIF